MGSVRRQVFNAADLVVVPPMARPVVIKSGGPIMDVESVESGQALCRWMDDEGKLCRAVFRVVCLYSCAEMDR